MKSPIPDSVITESARLARDAARDLGEDLSDSASKGAVALVTTAARNVGRVLWRQITSSRSRKRFQKEWSKSGTRADREAVVRELLNKDPKLRAHFAEILARRDYLIALESFCQRPAFLDTFLQGYNLTDVFVDPMLQVDAGPAHEAPRYRRATKFFRSAFSVDAEHRSPQSYLCLGDTGTGKTTLGQYLVGDYCRTLLGSAGQIDNRSIMLPVYIKAADLDPRKPFVEALHAAVERTLGMMLPAPLPPDFFNYHRPNAAAQWLIVVDRLDEIPLAADRLLAIGAIQDALEQNFKAYKFIITSRDTRLIEEQMGRRFKVVRLQEASDLDVRALASKYEAVLGSRPSSRPPELASEGLLATIPKTPLFVAMALVVRAEGRTDTESVGELFREFIDLLLEKRGVASALRASLLKFLGELAESPVVNVDANRLERAASLGIIESARPRTTQGRLLEERLVQTGLLAHRGNALEFIHATFRAYFRAESFATSASLQGVGWDEIDPFENGWDFAQFVLDSWRRDGVDVHAIGTRLLSFGDPGLRLFSRLAANDPCGRTSPALVEVAIEKWLRRIDEQGTGEHDGAVDYIALMARTHEAAKAALREIAADWRYHEDAISAARHLHHLGHTEESHAALLSLIQLQECELETKAIELLCQLGYEEEGDRLLREKAERLKRASTREDFYGVPEVAGALHRRGDTAGARSLLDSVAKSKELDEIIMAGMGATYVEIGAQEAVRPFIVAWCRRTEGISDAEEWADEFLGELARLDTGELMSNPPPLDASGAPRGELLEIWRQLPESLDRRARALEITRNGCVDEKHRVAALEYLATIDRAAFHAATLHLLEDEQIPARKKRDLSAKLLGAGLEDQVAEALSRFIGRSREARVEEAKLLAEVGRPAECIRHLERSAYAALGTEGRVASCRALCEVGASHIALKCFHSALRAHGVVPDVFAGIAAELLMTEHAVTVKPILWKLLDDASQPVERRLAVCKLLTGKRASPAERKRLGRYVRQIAHSRTPARYIRDEAWSLLDDLGFDCAWSYEEGSDEGYEEPGRFFRWPPKTPKELAKGEAGERIESIDARGEAGISRAFEPELLRIAEDERVTLRNRLEALIRLDVIGSRGHARRISAKVLYGKDGNTAIPTRLVWAYAAFLNGSEQADEARRLCEFFLLRDELDPDERVPFANFIGLLGDSVAAREHTRRLLKLSIEAGEQGSYRSLAPWNCAVQLVLLGERREAEAALRGVAEARSWPLVLRLYSTEALSQIGALDEARMLFRNIVQERSWSIEDRFEILMHCAVLRLDSLARKQLLMLTRDGALDKAWSATAYSLLEQMGYCEKANAISERILRSEDMPAKRALLQAFVNLKLWNKANGVIRGMLLDPNVSAEDRIAVLAELGGSPLKEFAVEELCRVTVLPMDLSVHLGIGKALARLGEKDAARNMLRALCDGRSIGVEERLDLVSALIEVGCDESAFDQMHRLDGSTLDGPLKKRWGKLRSNWSRSAGREETVTAKRGSAVRVG